MNVLALNDDKTNDQNRSKEAKTDDISDDDRHFARDVQQLR